MKIGSINENRDFEQRIAITPEIIKKYKSLGLEVCLSKNYGAHLGINDKIYEKEGAVILKNDEEVISVSSAILQMNILNDTYLNKLNKNQILIGVLNPYLNKEKLKNISFSSGGIFKFWGNREELFDKISNINKKESFITKYRIRHNYLFISTLLIILALEWFLRRRAGLI